MKHSNFQRFINSLLFLSGALFFIACSTAQRGAVTNPSAPITALMHQSAEDWNRGDLDRFMALYDTASTFLTQNGNLRLPGMRENYQRGFFKGNKPIQNLRFEAMEVRPLGNGHALLTGRFVLYGNDLPDRKGIYTLVFVQRGKEWKILHDHSS
jgi:ketosteroid isomerase-like protein